MVEHMNSKPKTLSSKPQYVKKGGGKGVEHTFLKRRYSLQTQEKCSKSLIIKEMQIKATMRYLLTLVRMMLFYKDSKC
jgi:hypothetical protein